MAVLDEIDIQIRPDGCIAFSALTAELLEVVAAIWPDDPEIKRRLTIMRQAKTAALTENNDAEELANGRVQPE